MNVSLPVPVWLEANTMRDQRGCWVWTRRLDKDGYAQGKRAGSRICKRVARVAYEFFVAPIPSGLQIDHLCRNKACVNPDHLEPVTCQENIARTERAQRTHCIHGHPLSGDNLVVMTWQGKVMRGL